MLGLNTLLGFNKRRAQAVASPLTVTLEGTPDGSSWSPVTGTEDCVHAEGAPASGPDTTSPSQLRAVASGGVPPYTYQWIKRSGSARISVDADTQVATTFSIDAGAYGSPVTAMYDCEVTDSAMTVASAAQDGQVVFDGGL